MSLDVVLASFPNAYSLQGTTGGGSAYSSAPGSQLEGKVVCLLCNTGIYAQHCLVLCHYGITYR